MKAAIRKNPWAWVIGALAVGTVFAAKIKGAFGTVRSKV